MRSISSNDIVGPPASIGFVPVRAFQGNPNVRRLPTFVLVATIRPLKGTIGILESIWVAALMVLPVVPSLSEHQQG